MNIIFPAEENVYVCIVHVYTASATIIILKVGLRVVDIVIIIIIISSNNCSSSSGGGGGSDNKLSL